MTDSGEGTIYGCNLESGALSVPSTDDTFGCHLPILPTEDLRIYSEQLLRMGKALDLDVVVLDPKPTESVPGLRVWLTFLVEFNQSQCPSLPRLES